MPELVSRHERVLVSFGGDTDRDRLKIGSIISVSLGLLLSKKEIDNFYRRNRLAISLSYGDDRSCAGAMPVSYTHLDVYKRQGVRFCPCNIPMESGSSSSLPMA